MFTKSKYAQELIKNRRKPKKKHEKRIGKPKKKTSTE
jgi:hypothetical protein